MEIPIVTIAIQGMRQTIQHAFTEHLARQDRDVQAALAAAIEAFDLRAEIERDIKTQFPEVLRSIIADALRQAIWNNPKIRQELTDRLAQELARSFQF